MAASLYDYQQLTLSSDDFNYGNRNQPIFTFAHVIDELDYLQVSRVIVPTTYYVFSTGYTSCTINGTAVSWGVGNYTPSEWISVVSPQVAGLTISYSDITNKLTFSAAGTITITFSNTQFAWELLGLNAGTNTNGTNTFTTPNVVSFSGPNYLLLRSSLASVFNQNSLTFSASTIYGNNVLCMIPITENRNSVILFQETIDRYFTWPTQGTKRIDLYFTLGQRSTPVDFNGQPFQVVLGSFTSRTSRESGLL